MNETATGSTPDTTRRQLLNWVLRGGTLALLGSVFYPIISFLFPPESGEATVTQVKLPFTRAELLQEDNRSKLFKFGRRLGIVVLTDDGDLRAFAATCTHLDCTVQHRPDLGIIWCACHNGQYDLQGRNIAGPPPRPLERYAVNERGDEIFVSKETA